MSGRAKFAIVEIDLSDHSHVRLHVLELPTMSDYGEFYRQTTSFTWFFHGRKRRNWSKTRHFHVSWWDEFEMQTKLNRKTMAEHCIRGLDDTELPTTIHASLWDFYKAVGYDYKTKKWVEKTPQKVSQTETK